MKKYYVMPKTENINLVDFSNAYTTNDMVCLELRNKTITNSAKNFEDASELIINSIKKFIKGSVNSISLKGNGFDLTFYGSDTSETFSKFNYGVFANNIPQYDRIEFSISGLVQPKLKLGQFKVKVKDTIVDNVSTVYCHLNGVSIDETELIELCVRIDCKYINVFSKEHFIYTIGYVGVNTTTGEEINSILVDRIPLTHIPKHLSKYTDYMNRARNNFVSRMANVG